MEQWQRMKVHEYFVTLDLRMTINQSFGPLLEICDKIKSSLLLLNESSPLEIRLPRIVVIGCESAGKSSVIERLANYRFFPRGEEITTRMPIKLILKKMSIEELEIFALKHWAPNTNPLIRVSTIDRLMQFAHVNNDLESFIKERMNEFVTERNGNNQGIIDDEFEIQIFSPNVTDMVLYDLPGVISTTLGRPNEPETLPFDTENMTRRFVEDRNNLLLTIVPCHTRMNTYPLFSIIEQSNAGSRCIGVLTKTDEFVKEVRDKVNAHAPGSIQLNPHGYIGVMNGNVLNKPIDQMRNFEVEFFKNEGLGDLLLEKKLGIDALIKKIVEGFTLHVNRLIPAFNKQLDLVLDRVNRRILALGDEVTSSNLEIMKENLLIMSKNSNFDYDKICKKTIGKINWHTEFPNIVPRHHIPPVLTQEYYFSSIPNEFQEHFKISLIPALFTKIASIICWNLIRNIRHDVSTPMNFCRFENLHTFIQEELLILSESISLKRLISRVDFGLNLNFAKVNLSLEFKFEEYLIGCFTTFFREEVITMWQNELPIIIMGLNLSNFTEKELERNTRTNCNNIVSLVNQARTHISNLHG
jgi:hypothetical protein